MEIGKRKIQPGIDAKVKSGLSCEGKFLPEWVLMDQRGREIFQEIKALPEFYVSSSISELSSLYHKAIASNFRQDSKRWNVIAWLDHPLHESSLVGEMLKSGITIDYFPITHSSGTVEWVNAELKKLGPLIQVRDATPDFSDTFDEISLHAHPTLFLFGPSAEGFESNDLAILLKVIGSRSGRRDRVVINFDLMKSPSVIEKAYYDYTGVNSLYYKSALERINREMGANFNLRQFEYWPIYDAVTGTCRRYLVSQTDQVIKFTRPVFEIRFLPWETISIGLSQKYDDEMISDLLQMSGMAMEKKLVDQNKLGALCILRSIRM
jgi:L-histidine N-alpha-methyltransferase